MLFFLSEKKWYAFNLKLAATTYKLLVTVDYGYSGSISFSAHTYSFQPPMLIFLSLAVRKVTKAGRGGLGTRLAHTHVFSLISGRLPILNAYL